MKNFEIKYGWVGSSDDESYQARSTKTFLTKREAYEDMRNTALEKMKWNTDFDEDLTDDPKSSIGYKVSFNRNEIVHDSYSGKYTYKIVPIYPLQPHADDYENELKTLKDKYVNALIAFINTFGDDIDETGESIHLDFPKGMHPYNKAQWGSVLPLSMGVSHDDHLTHDRQWVWIECCANGGKYKIGIDSFSLEELAYILKSLEDKILTEKAADDNIDNDLPVQ